VAAQLPVYWVPRAADLLTAHTVPQTVTEGSLESVVCCLAMGSAGSDRTVGPCRRWIWCVCCVVGWGQWALRSVDLLATYTIGTTVMWCALMCGFQRHCGRQTGTTRPALQHFWLSDSRTVHRQLGATDLLTADISDWLPCNNLQRVSVVCVLGCMLGREWTDGWGLQHLCFEGKGGGCSLTAWSC
jgi:hypothetical protein